ncbi:MAG: hypothetical protein NC548_10790 [Lachnospiraceae bacterium]|nr:hypothetical protein [Lachnospiraceae bacterium]MCM1236814.1 hypothetical protein [Ruminococcus flavefaciens]
MFSFALFLFATVFLSMGCVFVGIGIITRDFIFSSVGVVCLLLGIVSFVYALYHVINESKTREQSTKYEGVIKSIEENKQVLPRNGKRLLLVNVELMDGKIVQVHTQVTNPAQFTLGTKAHCYQKGNKWFLYNYHYDMKLEYQFGSFKTYY